MTLTFKFQSSASYSRDQCTCKNSRSKVSWFKRKNENKWTDTADCRIFHANAVVNICSEGVRLTWYWAFKSSLVRATMTNPGGWGYTRTRPPSYISYYCLFNIVLFQIVFFRVMEATRITLVMLAVFGDRNSDPANSWTRPWQPACVFLTGSACLRSPTPTQYQVLNTALWWQICAKLDRSCRWRTGGCRYAARGGGRPQRYAVQTMGRSRRNGAEVVTESVRSGHSKPLPPAIANVWYFPPDICAPASPS